MKRIDFAQNVNMLNPSPKVVEVVSKNLDLIFRYSESAHRPVLDAISKFVEVPVENLVIASGATEILFSLPRVVNKGKILLISPSFWEYEEANKKVLDNSIEHFEVEESSEFEVDLDKFETDVKSSAAVYICNPNNPTSRLVNKGNLLRLVKKYHSVDFVVDETYLIFREDYELQTLIHESLVQENLYVVTSLSKVYCIPGLRCGFLCAHSENISRYKNLSVPFFSSSLLDVAIPAVLADVDYLRRTRLLYKKQREKIFDLFSRRLPGKLRFYKPEANFVLAKILTGASSTDVANLLEKSGIYVRDCSCFRRMGHDWLRIAVRGMCETKILIGGLNRLL